ncbi:uncharacterized protein LOC108678251 [Hyalella azteca]|uniref:Uncharacterized protein LOC108678251 n=1 Tax=Hyalella azteca TaxID=294128 RepID=A0A8B7P7S7_HYAAZ|nr:uncharacterized protein LOC108678251 [Hyalella azteca]
MKDKAFKTQSGETEIKENASLRAKNYPVNIIHNFKLDENSDPSAMTKDNTDHNEVKGGEDDDKLDRKDNNGDINEENNVSDVIKDMDDILDLVGTGPWTYRAYAGATFAVMTIAVNLMGAEFTAPAVPFSCSDDLYDDVAPVNGTECFVVLVQNESFTSERPCQHFTFDNSTYGNTITSELELVCSKAVLQSMYQPAYTLGAVLGAICGGWMPEQ